MTISMGLLDFDLAKISSSPTLLKTYDDPNVASLYEHKTLGKN